MHVPTVQPDRARVGVVGAHEEFTSVDLPDPVGPTRPSVSPGSAVNETSLRVYAGAESGVALPSGVVSVRVAVPAVVRTHGVGETRAVDLAPRPGSVCHYLSFRRKI